MGIQRIYGCLCRPKVSRFSSRHCKNLFTKRMAWLVFTLFSGKPVAALYGFKYLSKYYAYLSGFDPAYSKYSPGQLLFSHAINKCIQEGLTEFDFLRGAETYKNRWNTMARWNRQATLTRKGLLAKIQNWLYKEYWRQGNRLKYVMKLKQ